MKRIASILILLLLFCLACNMDNIKEQLPVIKGDIIANKQICRYMEKINLEVVAEDPDGDTLNYEWICSEGSLLNKTSRQTVWKAPEFNGEVTISVFVSDGEPNHYVRKDISIMVHAEPLETQLEEGISIKTDGSIFINSMLDVNGDLNVNGFIRGEASYGYDQSGCTTCSTTRTTSVWVSDISAALEVKKNDLVMVILAANLRNYTPKEEGQHTVYMKPSLYTGPASPVLYPNWITVSTPIWSGGSSTGLYRANENGVLEFQAIWHVSGGTGYYVYANLIAYVIGSA